MSNGNVDMSRAERIDFNQMPNEADIAGFHNDAQREMDLQTAMLGTNHMDGGRMDMESRGFTSDSSGIDEQRALEQFQAADTMRNQIYNENTYVQAGQVNEADHFKKLYGDSENEKGELRRRLEAAEEAYKLMEMQMAQMVTTGGPVGPPDFFNSTPNQQYQPTQPVPNYPPQYGYNNAQNGYTPTNEVFTIDDNEVPSGRHIKGLINTVAPVIQNLQAQLEAQREEMNNYRKASFEQTKINKGITPDVERRLLVKAPWVRSITDPTAYLNVLTGMLIHERGTQGNGNGAQVGQVNPGPKVVPNRLLQRSSYVEGQGNQGGMVEDNPANRQAMFNQKVAEIYQKFPYGDSRRSAAIKQLLEGSGVNSYTGYRDPQVLAR